MIIRKAILDSMRNYRKHKKATLGSKQKRNKLIYNLKRSYGRNNQGIITVRHKSLGCKKLYREINFYRNNYDQVGTIKNIEYDPNRNAFLSLVEYEDGKLEYHIHIEGVKIGDKVISSLQEVEIKPGNATRIKNVPQGSIICCVAIQPFKRAVMARSAGMSVTLMEHMSDGRCLIKAKNGTTIKIHPNCMVTIGCVSNAQIQNRMLYKAGQNMLRGIRPTVRGVAMNPVDHPHGGGEGRGSSKRHPRSYSNKLAKGGKTAGSRSLNNRSIIYRRIKRMRKYK